jgi:hypothetical protein
MKKSNSLNKETLLSTLWIFVTFNYLYCDVVGLMDAGLLHQYLTGNVNGIEMNQGFLLAGGILMEIPIAMILLSRILPYKSNRITNMAAGSIKTIVMILTMFVGAPTLYYLFFGIIEILITIAIVWIAFQWHQKDNQELRARVLG